MITQVSRVGGPPLVKRQHSRENINNFSKLQTKVNTPRYTGPLSSASLQHK
jgi:hypothetical protein